ncbi:MAG: peptidylprolyl isomerase [Clostridiales Family XIII bacterium]|jgi:parvulin-like peptidyl-prolyl isomerase|nr:peptidylprolyl isomerase [Clostridiales Family XIII bacterium]
MNEKAQEQIKRDARTKRILLAIIIVLAAALAFTLGTRFADSKGGADGGSSSAAAGDSGASGGSSAQAASGGSGDVSSSEVIARVDGVDVTEGFVAGVNLLMEFLQTGTFSDAYTDDEKLIQENNVLVTYVVPNQVIRAHLESTGVLPLSEEQQAEISTNLEQLTSDADAMDQLAQHGIGEQEAVYYLESNTLWNMYVEEVAAAEPVTDADIQAYYEENPDYFVTPASMTASHILISDTEHTAEKRAVIEEVLAKAQAGEDFAALAQEYSEDTGTASSGGDLGTFTTGQMVQEFEDACLALSPGEISGIVETEYGYHIIKLVDKTDASTQPLEDASESIKYYIEQERATAALDALVAAAKVEYLGLTVPDTGVPPVSEEELATARG